MRQQFINTANLIVVAGFTILVFLLPLFYLQTTSEYFELNKQALLVGVMGILLLVWTVKMVVQRKVNIVVSPMTVPLLAFLGAYIISTIFSVDQFVSVFGYHGRFTGNIIQIAAVVLGFFILSSNLTKLTYVRIISHSFVASSLILSIYTVFLNYLQANSNQYADLLRRLPNFLPTNASPNIAALVLVAALLVGTGLLFSEKNSSLKSYLSFALALIGVGIAFTGSWISLVVLGVTAAIGLFFSSKLNLDNRRSQLSFILPAIAALVLFSLLLNLPNSPLAKFKTRSEATLSLDASWRIAASSLGIKPIQGIGPGTYAYAFSQFKPIELNIGEQGGLRFDRAYNFPLEIMTTSGLLGVVTYLWALLAFLVLVFRYLGKVDNHRVDSNLYFNILAATALLIAQLVVYPNTIIFTLFFTFAAIVVSHLRGLGISSVNDVSLILGAVKEGLIKVTETDDPEKLGRRYEILPYVFLLLALALVVPSFYFTGVNYLADTHYRNAILSFNNNKAQETLQNLVKAIQAQPRRADYHVALSQADLAILRAVAQDPKNASPSAEVQQNINNLGRQAIEQAAFATQVAPKNAFTYAYLGDVYKELAGNNIDALRNALNAYVASSNLDPNNFQLRIVIGDLFLRTGDFRGSADSFKQAILLKRDDPNPRYLLAVSYIRDADKKAADDKIASYQLRQLGIQAIQETTNVLNEVTKDKSSDVYKQQIDKLNKDIEEQKGKLEQLKPEVEQILKTQQQQNQPGQTQGAQTDNLSPTSRSGTRPSPTAPPSQTETQGP